MCVIAFSPKGKDIPTIEQIKSMWETNPDGAGYAYNRGDKVIFRKGFMTLDSLLKELEAPERFKNTNFAIHFRIGTSGINDAKTCHPFPVSTDFGTLRKTEGEEDAVLFHNGVIGEGGLVSPLSSDTQDLVVALAPMIGKYNKSKARDHYLGKLVSGNRLLIMYKNNAFKMYGDWKKDGNLWVSNLNYKYDYGWYGRTYTDKYGYTWDEDDWGNYDWYEKEIAKQKESAKSTISTPSTSATLLDSDPVVEKLWNRIIQKGYDYVDEEEMSALKKSADDYTIDELMVGGYTFGYDNYEGLIWLASEPEDTTKLNKEIEEV